MFGGIFFAISVITVVAVFALYRNAMAAVAFDFGCIGMHFGFRFARIVAIAAMDQRFLRVCATFLAVGVGTRRQVVFAARFACAVRA